MCRKAAPCSFVLAVDAASDRTCSCRAGGMTTSLKSLRTSSLLFWAARPRLKNRRREVSLINRGVPSHLQYMS